MEPGASSSKKTLTNWLDLPRDLTIQIFIKIGVVDLLCSAQSVCSSWRAIARDPRLYRVIDLPDPNNHFDSDGKYDLVVKLATEALDRSCGQAIEFSIGSPDYEMKMDILDQLKYKTPGLKCLRLYSCSCVDHECMIEVIPNLPLLGCSCPNLKSFRWNIDCTFICPLSHRQNFIEQFNDFAFAIVGNMNPSLRSLHLFGDFMNNTGLEAVLDRFSQLEYLDLRQCYNLDLNEDLLKRCQGIITLRLPKDSTKDFEHAFEKVLSSEDEEDENDGDFDKDKEDDSDYNDGDSDE